MTESQTTAATSITTTTTTQPPQTISFLPLSSHRDSYTNRFKITVSKSKTNRSRFGGVGVSEAGTNNSGLPNGEEQPRDQGLTSTRHGTSPHKVGSPTAGRNSAKGWHSLFKVASEKRARRVRFYRNGDRFFKGLIYAVSTERCRTFESLLTSLTASVLCDSKVMPNGVRYIFTLDGSHRLESLEELQEGESYVCASSDVFRALDYCKNEDPTWNTNMFLHHEPQHGVLKWQKRERIRDGHNTRDSESYSTSSTQSPSRPLSARGDKPKTSRSKSTKSEMCTSELKMYEEYQRSFVTPRLITVIRNGRRPRKVIRLLLNKKTAQSFDQVMVDITEAIKMDCGRVKKVYTMSGQQVMCLADFFQNENMFLACGYEKIGAQDFALDKQEIRQISGHRPVSGKSKEKALGRRSLHSISKCSGSATHASSDPAQCAHRHEHGESLHAEREFKAVNKDNIDSFISQLPMPVTLTNKYEVGALIGTGNFAVVMECREKKTNRKYALKIINRECCKGKEEMIDNEVRILRCVKHPNIIRLIEDFTNHRQIFYIMELVKGGDLFDAIASSSTKYTEQDASGMLYNLASALQYLHALSIVHRDVKPENILIRQHEDGTKSLKLGDFGLATEVRGPLFTVCGTPTYVAPEVIAETGYGLKIDIWSAGVIAYILLCGFPPFSSPNDDQDELFDLIMAGSYDFPSPYWDDVSLTAKNVIAAMLKINPETRLSAAQVLEHKWVAGDSQWQADLRNNVSKGLSTYFRREPRSSHNYAGIKVMATTALDKASKFFRGRGSQHSKVRGKEL